MTDFKEMAAQARAVAEAKIAETQAEQNRQAAARKQVRDAAIASLQTNVKPVLEQAKSDFYGQNIPAVIKENFDLVAPSISFRCVGPKIMNRAGGHIEPESVMATFQTTDGIDVSVRVGENAGISYAKSEFARIAANSVAPVIHQALERVLASYVEALHDARTSQP